MLQTMAAFLVILILMKMCLMVFADENLSSTLPAGCPNVTAANINITQMRGPWYIHKYTGPTDGSPLQTKCDLMDIILFDDNDTSGYVNYTFYPYKRPDELQVQVANLTVLPEAGTYRYGMYWPDFTTSMHTTVVHLTDDSLVQVACSETEKTEPHVIMASRSRNISSEAVGKMIKVAIRVGLYVDHVQNTDLTNCPYMTSDTNASNTSTESNDLL